MARYGLVLVIGKNAKNIPKNIKDSFPKDPIEVGHLSYRAIEAVGVPDVPVTLGRGNDYNGISHLWRDHKDIFVNPEKAVRFLKMTLGNSNCRVVVSLKKIKDQKCLKRIVLHNPDQNIYCVLVYDGKELKLVSWHNAPSTYGDTEWTLK